MGHDTPARVAGLAAAVVGGLGLFCVGLRVPLRKHSVVAGKAYAADICTGADCDLAAAPPPARPSAQTVAAVLDDLVQEARASSEALGVRSTARAPSPRLGPTELDALARRCAPGTPASVVISIIAVESGGRPLTLVRNGASRMPFAPASHDEATDRLSELQAQGASVDIGLMQINTSTLRRLNVPAAEALDPCRNIAIGAKVFDASYAAAFAGKMATPMLLTAYSAYNTGHPERGLRNGYAARAAAYLRRAKPAQAS